jgi:pSer/pThr/pTyr-binding forkhead associated (FHA) protein
MSGQEIGVGEAHGGVTRAGDGGQESLPAGAAAEAPFTVSMPGRKLVIALDGQQRRTYPLDSGTLTVGRSNDCDIRIHSPFVSRMHARICVRGAATFIEDLSSKNGILVNAKAIDGTAPLHDGDIVSLGGQLELKYVDLERRTGSVARH